MNNNQILKMIWMVIFTILISSCTKEGDDEQVKDPSEENGGENGGNTGEDEGQWDMKIVSKLVTEVIVPYSYIFSFDDQGRVSKFNGADIRYIGTDKYTGMNMVQIGTEIGYLNKNGALAKLERKGVIGDDMKTAVYDKAGYLKYYKGAYSSTEPYEIFRFDKNGNLGAIGTGKYETTTLLSTRNSFAYSKEKNDAPIDLNYFIGSLHDFLPFTWLCCDFCGKRSTNLISVSYIPTSGAPYKSYKYTYKRDKEGRVSYIEKKLFYSGSTTPYYTRIYEIYYAR